MEYIAAYGTLKAPEIIAALLGRTVDAVAGTVDGFASRALEGYEFPGAIECTKGSLDVLVVGPLTEAEIRSLDDYEGSFYDMRSVTAMVPAAPGSAPVICAMWVLSDAGRDVPAVLGEWDFDHWRVVYLESTLREITALSPVPPTFD